MTNDWIENLVQAHRSGSRFSPSGPAPGSLDVAYQIQSGVQRQMGPVGAFKTARKPDEPTIYAPIFAQALVSSGAQVTVRDKIGVELEVGFHIDRDLPDDPTPLTGADFAAFVTPVVVIELVDTRISGPLAQDPMAKLADNQINAGLVVGARATGWTGEDWGLVQASMIAGSQVVLDGAASVPGGAALETFAALAHRIGPHCGGLRKGQIVITGSLHPLIYLPAGTEIRGTIAGIGSVQVSLV